MDIQAPVEDRWLLGSVQCSLGIVGLHPASRVDYDETFSPMVKPGTIRTILTGSLTGLANALTRCQECLHGTLMETVYCTQPVGFVDSTHPNMVCKLNWSLYDLKQVPRAWYSRFATLLSKGFVEAKADTSMFVFCCVLDMTYLLYVNDIVLSLLP